MDFDMTKDEYSHLSSYSNYSYLPDSIAQPSEAVDDHNNLFTFLAVAQRHLVDFLPLTWQPSLGSVGRGASAEVEQSYVVKELGLAFKKFSTSPSSNETTLKGMTREISILQHPPIRKCVNIISIEGICWNFDNTDVGMSPVLVYRLGRNLVDHLRDTKVSFEERLQYVRDIGHGMMVLHASGAVHGDLKPENIIMNMDHRKTPPSLTCQIADFSFSYIALTDEERVRLPRSEPWSAPEWHARAHTLHQAQCMDVYSYGLLCYWVLFNDHIATKAHFAEGVGRIANLKAQGSLTDTILERIDNIDQSRSTISVLKLFFLGCLSNNREERYQLISRKIALLADTELADEVTVAVANSEHFNFKITDCLDQLLQVEYRIRQKIFQVLKKSLESRCQDCVKNAALQTGLCHCLALGTVKNVHAASEVLIEHGLSKADLNREMNSLQECEFPNRPGRAKWYVEPDLITQYQERGEMEEAIKLHEEEVIALKECLGANHPLVAMTTITLAHILDGAGQTLKALELCTEQCKLVKLRVDEDHYDNFSSLSQMAFYQWKAGYIEDAIVTGEKLVARLQNSKTIAQTDRLSMSSFSNLATAYVDAKQYEQALPMLLKLIELHDNVLGHDHPESLTTRQNLAVCYTEHIPPRFEEALDLQTAVLKAWRQNFGPKHRHTIGAAMVYASMLFREGSDDKTAFDLYEWAMETSKEQFSESNPDTWLATSNYAYMLIRFESVDQAITLLRRSLQKSEELLPHDHPNILDIMLRLSTAYIEQGMYDDAELLLKKVSQSAACMSQTKPTLKLWVWNGLGEIYQHRGVNALAKEAWERVLTSGKQYWGIHHPAVRLAMRYLGVLHIKEGRHDEGIHMLKKVVAWCKQYKGEADWESMHHRAQLGDSYNATGKFAEAQKILSEVFLLAKETLGATEGITIDVQGNLAYALKNSNQTEMAKDLAEDVMQKRISVLGRLHKDTLLSMRNLFCIYLELKLWSEASSLAQGISTALTELGDDLNDDTWQYLLVEFYARSNRLEEGQKYFLERLTKIKEQHGPEAACDTARYCLAYILSDDTNRLCDAAKLMDQVLTYRISQFGEYSSPTCQAAGLLGVILRDKGDLTGAVAMFQQELRVSRSLKDGLNVHDILFASEHLITVYKKLGYTEEIVNVEKAIEDLELG